MTHQLLTSISFLYVVVFNGVLLMLIHQITSHQQNIKHYQ